MAETGKIAVELISPTDPAERVNHWGTVNVADLVTATLEPLGLARQDVGEILLTPGRLEVRVYLKNLNGEHYIWGAEGDPGRNLMADDDPRRGKVAEEVWTYEAQVY